MFTKVGGRMLREVASMETPPVSKKFGLIDRFRPSYEIGPPPQIK